MCIKEDEKKDLQFYYSKAIESRTLLYNNFNYWMNFFAIVVGALFVAYYTVTNVNSKNQECISLIIGCLGFIASTCWFQSLKGFYHWMKSRGNVVRYYEEKLNDKVEDKNFVYSLYMDSNSNKSVYNILSPKNVSTQKIMIRFVCVIIVSWVVMIILNLVSFDYCNKSALEIVYVIAIPAITIFLWLFLFVFSDIKSNVSEHHKLIKENNNQYKIEG